MNLDTAIKTLKRRNDYFLRKYGKNKIYCETSEIINALEKAKKNDELAELFLTQLLGEPLKNDVKTLPPTWQRLFVEALTTHGKAFRLHSFFIHYSLCQTTMCLFRQSLDNLHDTTLPERVRQSELPYLEQMGYNPIATTQENEEILQQRMLLKANQLFINN